MSEVKDHFERVLTIDQFQGMLKDDELRISNVPAGRYFVDRDGQVVSMNMVYPRYIEPIKKVNGEYSIILYTPSLMAYDLAQLVLSTFQKPQDDSQKHIFRNSDLSDCRLTNLAWADKVLADESMRKATNLFISRQNDLGKIKQAEALCEPEQEMEDTHAFFNLPVATVDSCISNSFKFRRVMGDFCNALSTYLHTHQVDDEEQFHIRMAMTTVEHMSTLLDLPLHALTYVINTPPKTEAAMIIFEQTSHRVKGLLNNA